MECGHTGGGDVGHSVGCCSADVEDEWYGQVFDELGVHVHEEAPVVFAADEVAGGVVGQGESVGAGFDFGRGRTRW